MDVLPWSFVVLMGTGCERVSVCYNLCSYVLYVLLQVQQGLGWTHSQTIRILIDWYVYNYVYTGLWNLMPAFVMLKFQGVM